MELRMASFTRTIPSDKNPDSVQKILSRPDHYLPLTFRPLQADPGDYLYLVYRGKIVGRVRISSINNIQDPTTANPAAPPSWAKWLVLYKGKWEIPPRDIFVQGHQGVRYLENQGLINLDLENWNPGD
jgi:hypothetical protein